MKVGIVGSGHVGTTLAACLADVGHEVTNVDVDERVVEALRAGEAPIEEPGLDELVARHAGDRLLATTDYAALDDSEVVVVAVPTPSKEDGALDTTYVESAAESLGPVVAESDVSPTIAVKSTVVPGTTTDVVVPAVEAAGAVEGEDFEAAVAPEFLRQGSAVVDVREPDKVVFGTRTDRSLGRLKELYAPIIESADPPVVETGLPEAEMIKHANNAYLASKISLTNDIGNICKLYGVDAFEVMEAIGLDDRIADSLLRSGLGWGGRCFPKDTSTLIAAAREKGYDPLMLQAAVDVNERQPRRLLAVLDRHVDVAGERVAVLGLSYKPGTEDIHNSDAIPVIEGLRERGAAVVGYDPLAGEKIRERFPDLDVAETAGEALEGAVAVCVCTDWEEFANLDDEFDRMATPVVVDGRRIVTRREGIVYEGLTW